MATMWPATAFPSYPANSPRSLVAVVSLLLTSLPISYAASSHGSVHGYGPETTCVARAVNYITHGLPQQCLTSFSAYPTAPTTPESTTPTSVQLSSQTATATIDPGIAPDADGEDDDDNELSTGSFMSFDEWKAMMVAKAEDSEPKRRRVPEGRGEASKGDFASLGDEGEIDLDFDAYSDRMSDFTASSSKQGEPEEKQENKWEKVTYEEGLAMVHRSKDAGKTCKERFSYSSFDAGATVIKTSKPIKNPSAILLENKDAYMLMECATENKFFIVELSDDILVDTVVLANYEFFSSMMREFRVSISDRYPVKADKWKVLGTFQARNARDIQPFLIEHPQDWARYLRVEILNHWGNEFYCPVSLLRVHGTRMMEAFKEPEALDDDADDEPPKPLAIEDAKAQERTDATDKQVPEEPVEVVELEPETVPEPSPPGSSIDPVKSDEKVEMFSPKSLVYFDHLDLASTCPVRDGRMQTSDSHSQPTDQSNEILFSYAQSNTSEHITEDGSSSLATHYTSSATSSAHNSSVTLPADSAADSSVHRITVRTMIHNNTTSRSSEQTITTSTAIGQPTPPRQTALTEAANNPPNHSPRSQIQDSGSPKAANSQQQNAKSSATISSLTTRSKASPTTGASAASPTVQDSFFKALTKRLQILESNTTLSLQYIESQSRFVQEALAKLEKRQISRVDKFLNTLNNTVLNELRDVRKEVHQIWQSTVIALETQREQAQQENLALGSRVSVLADEVVFQKRMAIVQSILLLICLVLVIFSRGFQGAGMMSADGSYSGQFFAASSRMGSPAYPMTPKSAYRDTPVRDRGNSLEAPRDITPRPANNRAGTSQERNGQGSLRPPPTLSRSTSATAAELQEYYNQQLPTPCGSVSHCEVDQGEELGYDSEPNMTPSRRSDFASKNADYFFSAANSVVDDAEQDARNGGVDGIGSGFGGALERQHTPTSEDMPDEDYTPRQSTGRVGLMHTGSTRKPLPALPEDPD